LPIITVQIKYERETKIMPDRETLIRNINVGDIFHAKSPNGASLICLATAINEATVHARTVTTQINLEFDRITGVAEWGADRIPCKIDSVSPLPAEIHNVFLGLDHRYRTSTDPERTKLTEAEKRALSFIYDYYRENQI
jgi:hypothetical protein